MSSQPTLVAREIASWHGAAHIEVQMRFIAVLLLLVTFPALASIPRPEFPDPQFERKAWVNLNGQWDFAFDDQNRGLRESWMKSSKPFTRKITVPFAFETRASGIGDNGFHPWVWYRRSFETPPAWKGKRVFVHFGAVDYRAQVWVNGAKAGEHVGGQTPFRFDITPLLRPGKNQLTVRVEDPPRDLTILRGKQSWDEEPAGIFYSRTSGIWQTVRLEAVGSSALERIDVRSAPSGHLVFNAVIDRPNAKLTIHAKIFSTEGPELELQAPAAQREISLKTRLLKPRLWSPESPHLYRVVYELRKAGQPLDTVHSYFGIRTVEARQGRILINGRPVYLKMVLDQGYWPESNMTPPSDRALREDIAWVKKMGFNGVRKHQKLEDPRFLYWADSEGLLVVGEFANAIQPAPGLLGELMRQWREAVDRDRNHPSIVIWAPLNETWGFPESTKDSSTAKKIADLYRFARSLDGSRPVIDNDGWEHTPLTDIYSLHDYKKTGDELYRKYQDYLRKPYKGMPLPRLDYDRPASVPGTAYNGAPLLLSEFGGIAFVKPGEKVPSNAWGYEGIEPSPEQALARFRGLFGAIAKLPGLVGYCYTQLTDIEQEINGLLTYDRKPKLDTSAIRAINDSVRFQAPHPPN